jgi:hypothetical protein
VATREDRREQLLDDLVLPHNHLLQFILHEPPVLGELVEDVVEGLRLGRGRHGWRDPSLGARLQRPGLRPSSVSAAVHKAANVFAAAHTVLPAPRQPGMKKR